jgi:tetratricopeptide (TPR) repeat protein
LQAQSALKTGSWDLSLDMKKALVKVRVEIARKQQENSSYIDNVVNCIIIDPNTKNPAPIESLLQNKLANNDEQQSAYEKKMWELEHRKHFKTESYDGILSSVRERLINGNITIDELLQRGDAKFERNNFQGAIKLYTLGIDQIQQYMYNDKHKKNDFKLAKLIVGRAKCNLKMAQIRQSKEHCEHSLKDTDFILKSQCFDIKCISSDSDFYQQLIKLNDQAQILSKNLEMNNIPKVRQISFFYIKSCIFIKTCFNIVKGYQTLTFKWYNHPRDKNCNKNR